MLRMEIALFLVMFLVSNIYFSAERRQTELHKTFSRLLILVQANLVFDGVTVYTVNHLEQVPDFLNALLHRCFIGTLIGAVFLFYRYIAILVQSETGKPDKWDRAARGFLVFAVLWDLLLPVHYARTPEGNYSDGIHAVVCYLTAFFYLILCAWLLIRNWKRLEARQRRVIACTLSIELGVTVLQGFHPTWLISGMGLTLMTLAFYLTLENPALLRAELQEQKMSILYLKSQINPHFLYNTLDSIRIRAQLNGDRQVAELLMRLVDFFRYSVKVSAQMVPLDEELELLEAYMELMCSRYPELKCEYDIDPELTECLVPNFILQPIVENSLLHGLKSKGYQGLVRISARRAGAGAMEIRVYDTGRGFAPGEGERVAELLRNYRKVPARLEGSSIGVLNVQKRIKLLCGPEYGLSYSGNDSGGLTACLRLSIQEEASWKS